jgi:dihydrofolate synthase/folylpolyglutamate synthase
MRRKQAQKRITTKAQPKSAPLRSDVVLDRLNALHPKAIDLSLSRTEELLTTLGNPERSLANVVHIAGTNGKGSTLAFLKAICEAAGLTVNCYTSPHLIRFAERISIAGSAIDEATLISVLEECEAANTSKPITLFEITTVAAFLAFSRQPADVTLIETGLGGRFDSTNVFKKPALTIITPISMDHMNWLGDTLAEIAFEKAGILKTNVPAVIGPQQPDAAKIIQDRAEEISTKTIINGNNWDILSTEDTFSITFDETVLALARPSLTGDHQITNAATAAVAAKQLTNLSISDDAIRSGIKNARWPGRLQLLDGALAKFLPEGWSLWLDGGHNAAASEALAAVAKQWDDQPLHLIFGFLNSRDPQEFLSPLADHIDTLQAVPIPGEEASLSATETATAANQLGIATEEAEGFAEALPRIVEQAEKPGRILICGSLYLAGAVLAYEEAPPKDGAS